MLPIFPVLLACLEKETGPDWLSEPVSLVRFVFASSAASASL
jgi:hypothetical protein